MKRFTFKFERLRKLREREEEACLLRLALAQTDLAREQKAMAALAEELEQAGLVLAEMVRTAAPAPLLRNADAFRRAVSAAAARQHENLLRAEKNLAEKQEEFRRAHRKAECIRRLQERRRLEHRALCLREEQRHLDEVGGRTRHPAGA